MERIHKRSKKRDAILSCIRSTRQHPSAEWIYSRLKPEIPDLSRGTVYRNLRLFLDEGAIASVGVVNGLERFDGDTSPHAHFVCQGCGEVVDLPGLAPLESMAGKAEALTGGQIGSCALIFSGMCRSCIKDLLRKVK